MLLSVFSMLISRGHVTDNFAVASSAEKFSDRLF